MSTPVLGIVIFDGVELLDFAGPLEVFCAAAELASKAPFEVATVSLDQREVTTAHGLKVKADHDRNDAPPMDGLLVPGGVGIRRVMKSPELMNWLIARGESANQLMSVCTGALALGAAGFLQGVNATTHQQFLDELSVVAPACNVIAGRRFVEHGAILTAAGVSAGLDLALHVVEQRSSRALALKVSEYVEYPPKP